MPSTLLSESRVLAQGQTAEVYAWGEGRILKLFRAHFPQFLADYEALCSEALSKTDLPVARLIERAEIDGRFGLVFERVEGLSGLEQMAREPLKALGLLRNMAEVQRRINRCEAPAGIHALHSILEHHISRREELSPDEKAKILAYLDKLPRGNTLCHADLHPGQMILSPKGPIVIDWANAARGTPAADIARSWMLLRLGPPIDNPWLGTLTRSALAVFAEVFLRRRLRQENMRRADVKAWLLPLMAARLDEPIPGEAPRLLRGIRQELSRSGKS